MMTPLFSMLIALVVMYFLAELFRSLSVPRVVSHIIAGMVLGVVQFRTLIFPPENVVLIEFLSQMGFIVLLFFVGLQMNITQFEKSLGSSALVSFFNTALPLILGYLASHYLFGLSNSVSLIVGICMSVSASAIALDIMEEMGKLRTKLGIRVVSAGTFDDIFELFLITVVLSIMETAVQHKSISELIVGILTFAIVVICFRFWFIPWMIKRIEHQVDHAQLFTGALIITLLLAVLSEWLGISALLGSLFSGVILRQILFKEPGHKPWERVELMHSVHTIAFGLLVPFFFFYVGFQTDVIAIWNNMEFGVVITLLSIFGTVVGSSLGYVLSYHNWKEGWIMGWAMNAKGDTELVIAQLALSAGVISTTIFSAVIFMAVVSTIISPFVLRYLLKSKEKDYL